MTRYGMVETADRTRRFEIVSSRPGKDFLIVRFKDIGDRGTAERLRNVELFVPRDRLPEPAPDEFYYVDLVGLAVEDLAGRILGRIIAVRNFGGGDLLEIVSLSREGTGNAKRRNEEDGNLEATSETVLIPFTVAMVPSVDIAAGKIVVDPLPGLFDGDLQDVSPEDGSVGDRDRKIDS